MILQAGELTISPEQQAIRARLAVALAHVEAWQPRPMPPGFMVQPRREFVRPDGRWLRT